MSLIVSAFVDPKTFPQVCKKFSAGHIQTGLMDFLPPQVCGRSCRGIRLDVFTFREYSVGGGGVWERGHVVGRGCEVGRGDEGGSGDEGWVWSRMKYEISRM